MLKLNCACCGKDMGIIRDGKVRDNMVVYCAVCDIKVRRKLDAMKDIDTTMPGFLQGLFGGGRYG